MKKIGYKLITPYLFFLLFLCCFLPSVQGEPTPSRRVIRILSIDGGGIRGIIPALILEHIESRLLPGMRIADCFDIISGTSTGGLITLMLTKANEKNEPQYTAKEIVSIYERLSKDVFSQSFWQWAKSGNGWWDAKYSEKPLEKYLEHYLGNARLKECVTNVIIPAYEIEQDKTFFFKSCRAKNELKQDCYLKDLGRATSAAPTYFRPATLIDGTGQRILTLVDGGLGANNPTLAATVHAIEIFGKDIDFFIVSLGTGSNYGATTKNISREEVRTSGLLGWARKIIPTIMYAVNDITDYEMYYVFNHGQTKQYFRFQPILEAHEVEMDNISEENIQTLKRHAQSLIAQHQEEIGAIVKTLNIPK